MVAELTARPTDAEFLARARALVPVLAAREAAAAARNVPAETIADLRETGLLRLLRPRRFGGYQASVGVFLDAVEILAEECASTGWVYGVLGELEWVVACLPEQAQIDIWGGNPDSVTVATTIPSNVAVKTNGVGGFQDAGLLSEEAGMVPYGRFLTQAP